MGRAKLLITIGEIGGRTVPPAAAFIQTDASITHGNSGGPAVDDKGRLVGIATASRTKLSAASDLRIDAYRARSTQGA